MNAATNDIASMVQELYDRQAIRDQLNRYCRAMDRFDRELLLSVYHPDAIDDHGLFVGSPEAFADWAFGVHGHLHNLTQHVVTNHDCELAGDVAHCETYWMLASMNKQGAPLSLSGGRYIDRFERRNGTWRIAARKCVPDWRGVPGESVLSPEARADLASGGHVSRDRKDVSYERPLTIDPARIGHVFK